MGAAAVRPFRHRAAAVLETRIMGKGNNWRSNKEAKKPKKEKVKVLATHFSGAPKPLASAAKKDK
jgi:hypothetical protein